MYSVFTWVYGVDLTEVFASFQNDYRTKQKKLEEFYHIPETYEDDIISSSYAGSGDTPYYIGFDFDSWDEMDKPKLQPIDVTKEAIEDVKEKLKRFKEQEPKFCSFLESTYGFDSLIPKIFLSRSTS